MKKEGGSVIHDLDKKRDTKVKEKSITAIHRLKTMREIQR